MHATFNIRGCLRPYLKHLAVRLPPHRRQRRRVNRRGGLRRVREADSGRREPRRYGGVEWDRMVGESYWLPINRPLASESATPARAAEGAASRWPPDRGGRPTPPACKRRLVAIHVRFPSPPLEVAACMQYLALARRGGKRPPPPRSPWAGLVGHCWARASTRLTRPPTPSPSRRPGGSMNLRWGVPAR